MLKVNVHLTEETIRSGANEQSFQKGREYYRAGAVHSLRQQVSAGSVALTAECEGSSAPSYRLRVELDDGGIRSAVCSCPYDWGGYCKHIVALLLTYIHKPEDFTEQKNLTDLLSGLDKDALIALIMRLVEQDPDLYDRLESSIPVIQISVQSKSGNSKEKRQTQVSEQAYRKQVRYIFKQSRYDGNDYDNWDEPAYIEELEEVLETAVKFLDASDAEGALIILRVLLEEITDEYEDMYDESGDLACVLQDIGMPMAEAILSADLNAEAHKELEEAVQSVFNNLDESIEESELEVILAALEHGWDELPDEETEWEEYDEEYWMTLEQLKQARLNVLTKRGDTEAFLQLAQKSDPQRYALKLLELGRVDEAVTASQELGTTDAIFIVAQRLRDAGRLDAALALAERGLALKEDRVHALAAWLAPLEETQGRKEMALEAYRTAFDAQPAIDLYRHIKRLSGVDWSNIRPALVQKAGASYSPGVLVDILLEEKDWDAAIAIAEKQIWIPQLLEKVADALIPHRPDWVIRIAIKQSNSLIEKTQSNLYPGAARWLLKAKKAYQEKGQVDAWQAYISHLRTTYARRPALQKAIAGL
jgi:uncharacterized Zn finger protein